MKLRTPINRRRFLRNTGIAVALPYLASVSPRPASAQDAPAPRRRFVSLFFPNGTDGHREWRPRGNGLGAAHEALGPFQGQMTFIDNLDNTQMGGRPPAHARSTASFLTGTAISQQHVGRVGVSADQVVASTIGHQTPWASLELGPDPYPGGRNPIDTEWSTTYNCNLSWSSTDAFNAPEQNARAVFDRLFGPALQGATEAADRRRRRRSILDYVRDEASRLQGKVNPADRRKLDQYLTAIRDVERRLEQPMGDVGACGVNGTPEANPADFPAHTRQMMDLLVLALQCDMTRVVTYMMDFGFGNKDFSFLVGGRRQLHHNITHSGPASGALEKHRQITGWYCDQYAYLLGQMAGIDEGNGSTLLDNSMVLFGSGLGSGRGHDRHNMPLILGGGGAGALRPGGRYDGGNESHCRLLLSLIQKMGVDVNRFGDANAPLANF